MTKHEPTRIQIRVREIRQLFNSMDPSPFRDRDLDPDCEEFIVSWAREFGTARPFELQVHLECEALDAELTGQIAQAVQGHFRRDAELQKLRLRRLVRDGRISLGVGLLAFIACMTTAALAPFAALGAFGNIVAESLVIAGWVVMWHPLDLLMYGFWPVRRERKLLQSLGTANVSITSSATTTPTSSDA